MNFDFSTGRITLVLGPFDMRSGYNRLSLIALSLLGIDVDKGEDFVVFASRRRQVVKVIWRDERGCSVLTRRLNEGRFARFVAAPEELGRNLSAQDLFAFLDGKE